MVKNNKNLFIKIIVNEENEINNEEREFKIHYDFFHKVCNYIKYNILYDKFIKVFGDELNEEIDVANNVKDKIDIEYIFKLIFKDYII